MARRVKKRGRLQLSDLGQRFATFEVDWKDADDETIAGFVDYHYRAGKTRRAAWEAQAAQQLAWSRGNQHLVWDRVARDLIDRVGLETDNITQPVAINVLRAFVEQSIGLNFARPVTWESRPMTEDDADIAAAKLGTQLLQYYWQTGPGDEMIKLLEALWMMYCTGLSFIRITWDPFAGVRESFGPDYTAKDDDASRTRKMEEFKQSVADKLQRLPEQLLFSPDGKIKLPAGEPAIDYPSGFDITEPLHCKSVAMAPWIIHSRYMEVETVRARYGEKAADIGPDLEVDEYYYRTREQYGNLHEYSSDQMGYEDSHDQVMVHTLWRPASEVLEKGYYAVVADKTCLVKGENPYNHGRIPLIALREMPDPEHFRPGCTIRDLMGLQGSRNERRARLHKHEDKVIDPKVMVEKGATVPEDAFSAGAKIIPVGEKDLQLGRIKAFEQPRLSPEVLTIDQMDRADMFDIANIHRSTMGEAEGASQSGKHAAMMQNADMRGNVTTRLLLERALGQAGGLCLSVIHQFANPKRTISILGERGESLALTFQGKDLRAEDRDWSADWNVHVKLGIEPDLDIELQKIETLTQLQYLRPDRESDRLQVLKWLGERTNGATDDYSEHRVNAARENRTLMEGKDIQVAMGDADDIHIEEHLRFTTIDAYKKNAVDSDLVTTVMLRHIMDHYHSRAEKLARPEAILEETKARLRDEMKSAVPGKVAATPGAATGPVGPAPMAPPIMAGGMAA